jgi:serine protease Do
MLLVPLCQGAPRLGPAEKRTMELGPAVVLVVVTYQVTAAWEANGQQQGMKVPYTLTGTGFIYRPDGYIITNGHVVADSNMKDQQAQEEVQTRIKRDILGEFERKLGRPLSDQAKFELLRLIRLSYSIPELKVYLANRVSYNAEIKVYSDPITRHGKDVAVLKIDASNLPTVPLGNSDNVHVQEPITVIGYPGAASPLGLSVLGVESLFVPTVTNGHVSAVKTDYKGTPVIQSDAAITHGNSGGPAFNEAGEVIGIATFGPEVAGFNFFVPINTAWEFVRQAGTKPEAGLFNDLWAKALDTYDAGQCETAKKRFDSVLRIMPNLPDATRLSAAAEGCAQQEGWLGRMAEGSGWLLYAVAGLAIVGLIAFFLLRGRASVTSAAVPSAAVGAGAARRIDASPPAPAPDRAFGSVQVTAGALSGKRYKITKEGLLIGRDAARCQIALPEDTVSKEHAWIVPLDNNVVVIDRGSANGTYVNSPDSARVSKIGLQNGDRIYIGKQGATVLTYFSS